MNKIARVPKAAVRTTTVDVSSMPDSKLCREITELVNRTTDEVEAEPYPESHTLYGNTYAGPDDAWAETTPS